MDYVKLGSAGMKVSRICLGMMSYGNDSDRPWVLDEAAAEPIIHRAVEAGVTFFDTADVYSQGASEVATGRLVSKFLSRDEAVIATKVHGQMTPGPNGRGLSRKHVLEACHQALKRLRVDYLDLYYCHRPDPDTPVGETVAAMDHLVRQGKVLYWGTSEWPGELIREAAAFAAAHGMAASRQGPHQADRDAGFARAGARRADDEAACGHGATSRIREPSAWRWETISPMTIRAGAAMPAA